MPPKKALAAATESGAVSAREMKPEEAFFLVECVRAIDTDGLVNLTKVTNALGNKSIPAMGNRFRALRKKYGLNLGAKSGSCVITSQDGGNSAAGPASSSQESSSFATPAKTPVKVEADSDEDEESDEATPVPVTAKKANVRRPRKGAKANQGPISAAKTPLPATPVIPSSANESSCFPESTTKATPTPNPAAAASGSGVNAVPPKRGRRACPGASKPVNKSSVSFDPSVNMEDVPAPPDTRNIAGRKNPNPLPKNGVVNNNQSSEFPSAYADWERWSEHVQKEVQAKSKTAAKTASASGDGEDEATPVAKH